jgi:hypothetical protein
MNEKLRFLGLDVHAETIAVAVAEPNGEVRSLGTIANREDSVRRFIRKLGSPEAKMKVWTSGRYMSSRFVISTLCGQTVNTAVFYIFGLWGMIPTRLLTKSIVVASLTKVSLELLLLPVTLKASLWLKKIENVDYFDKETNFNPLRF